MKTLYLDCGMGAAGDMLAAALLELLPDPDGFIGRLNGLEIPGVRFEKEPAVKCGITGTRVIVTVHGHEEGSEAHEHHHGDEEHGRHHHEEAQEHHHHDEAHGHTHHHSGMEDIRHIVYGHTRLPQSIADEVMRVYETIAAAESRVHGVEVSEVHFHEVGAMDAIADIAAVCMLMDELSPDEVVVSPVHVGYGQVNCAHGILPVPAPATARILMGVPTCGGSVEGELCTPTGAALLKHFADRFGQMPVMAVSAVGYGMGKKDFPAANCVRAMLGESADGTDTVTELTCNIDDMTAEEIGFATERLFEGGAKEVYTVGVGMKKNRPGTLLCVLCDPDKKEQLVKLICKHTTTLGVRETPMKRYTLRREISAIGTPYGEVRVKEASGYGAQRKKIEYEDLARVARENGWSLFEARKRLEETE